MTIRAQIPASPQSTVDSEERHTLELEPHLAPIRNAFALLDHRTHGRSVARGLAPPGRYLVVEQGDIERLIPLDRPAVHIGRGITADIRLEDACISRRHAIVAQLDAAQADLDAFAEGAAGPLRLGIYQSVGARILPGLIRRFKQDWPRVEVSVREEIDASDLLRLLEHGELDLTFADLPLPEGPFESEEVLRDPYVLLVQADSELGKRDSAPSFRELSGVPIVTWRHVGEHESYLRGRVPDLNIVFRSDDNGTLVGLVAEGLGVAVVPQLVVNPRNPAYVALPFGNRIPPRHLAIVWHRDRFRSAATESFVELAKTPRMRAVSPETLRSP